ncbi:GNAT family N-acetyltransferase/peptidase C39 family protein [Pararhodospirillum photometricum]|uniref:GCN5-related N-acetyltransferase n=1 Tax=Pararhodospirillum photometricum DSM 122 TaxID=1150469 RepID=H6SNQ6_PARPM|nr:GNAT family N-acetyltransferase/peptidase C39 family protein [Pararhodospirillum photometricum]CCG09387.1 GCN5-related N-acetyltransferase [Pararhodospirillum photometricum DSM 122]
MTGVVRALTARDLPALVALEEACFTGDRMSRRSFQRLLKSPNALFVGVVGEVEGEEEGPLAGYALVLVRTGTLLARLYSLAVAPAFRGRGLGRVLLDAAEARARTFGAAAMRLEVRPDNAGAIALYRARGYRDFAIYQKYYEDLSDALRMSKSLLGALRDIDSKVPLYHQTLPFSCGAACLMMAMHALDASQPMDQTQEIRLWREATTIFMTSGHGGCGPHGLALAAHRRGFRAEVYVSETGPLFVESVRDPRKREVLRLVHEEFEGDCHRAGVPVIPRALSVADVTTVVAQGGVPIVLVSQYRLLREKAPHWVVVSAVDDHCIYVNDPDVDLSEETSSSLECLRLPIPRRDFESMARFGRSRLRASVVLYPADPPEP